MEQSLSGGTGETLTALERWRLQVTEPHVSKTSPFMSYETPRTSEAALELWFADRQIFSLLKGCKQTHDVHFPVRSVSRPQQQT